MRPGGGGVLMKLMGGGAGGTTPPPTTKPSLWRTPTPYFLSLAFMMGVIAVALLVLICTRKKAASSSSSSRRRGAEDDEKAARALAPLDREPKVVVFMPGDHHVPSFLASVKPLIGGDGTASAAPV